MFFFFPHFLRLTVALSTNPNLTSINLQVQLFHYIVRNELPLGEKKSQVVTSDSSKAFFNSHSNVTQIHKRLRHVWLSLVCCVCKYVCEFSKQCSYK